MNDEDTIYDVIILGAGPAGLTSGIYTIRRGAKTLILEAESPGGRAASAPRVENYPGFVEPITGIELTEKMYSQLKRLGGQVKREEVISLELDRPLKKSKQEKTDT